MEPSSNLLDKTENENENENKNVLIIKRKLGQGKFSVYYADCPSKKTGYALKIFPRNLQGILQFNKEKFITKLNHPNIIQYIPIQFKSKDFYSLATEFAPYGDLFEWMTYDALNDILVRTYFHQFIEGLEYIHSKGIAHLDLKLENLMIGEEFKLKIIDFDQSQLLKDRWITSGGTLIYRAPEVVKKVCKNLTAVDIYSAGVTLYCLITKEYPFVENDLLKNKEVSSYQTFVQNNENFWKGKVESCKKKGYLNQDFIDLINGMLELKPEKRLKIEGIKGSKWYQGPVLDQESLKTEMQTKWEIISKKNKDVEKQQIEQSVKKTWGKGTFE